MRNSNEKMKKMILSFTYQEQRKIELENFKKRKQRLIDMSCDEIDLEYFKCKAEYEHKKMILPLFLVSIFIATLMNWWKHFYNFVEKMLVYSHSTLGRNEVEAVQTVLVVFSIIMVTISICILMGIVAYVRKIYALSRELLLIEEVRNNKKKKSNGENV